MHYLGLAQSAENEELKNMTICEKGATRHLLGNLTWSAVNRRHIDALESSLQAIAATGEKDVRIDCVRIGRADIYGLQLLYVWMECARSRGMEMKLVNLSSSLRQAMSNLGLMHCFSGKMA